MKVFIKILVALIIVAALCFGIYCILPETSKMYIKANIQYRTNDEAKAKVDSLKSQIIKITEPQDNGTTKVVDTGVPYGDALERVCKSTAWYYESDVDGSITITFYGTKASLDLSKYGSDGTFIDKPLKVVFYFPSDGKGGTITLFIDNEVVNDAEKVATLHAIADK